MTVEILIGLACLNLAVCGYGLFIIIKFERLLGNASQGAADHFEKLRKMRQMGT